MRLLLMLVALSLAACEPSPDAMQPAERPVVSTSSESSADVVVIEAVLEQYNRATTTRSVEVFETLLHPEARQFVTGPRFMVLDTPTFLQLLGDGAIGGVERDVVVHGIEVDGPLASAHVTFVSDAARFDNYFSLLKLDGAWQIVGVIIEMKPQGAPGADG